VLTDTSWFRRVEALRFVSRIAVLFEPEGRETFSVPFPRLDQEVPMNRLSIAFVISLGLVRGVDAQEPLAVRLTAGTARQVTQEEARELEARFRDAQKACEELEKGLKKQYGKKVEAWPQEQQDALRAARDGSAQAQTDWLYSGMGQKEIDDSLRDVTEKLSEKKTIRIVATPTEADLVVELIGRGKVSRDLGWGGEETAAEVAMRVSPGGRLDGPKLAEGGAVFRAKKSAWSRAGAFTIHDYSTEAPYWSLISRKPMVGFSMPWKGAAGQAADAFERFAGENAESLASARVAAK
jgi:hypothetical protein